MSHSSANSLTPLQRHVRSLLWYQICFLDFKTAEAQGPHPSIRADDFDIALPLNVDDDVFEFGSPSWRGVMLVPWLSAASRTSPPL